MWITGKVPNLSHPSSSRHCAPSPELLQVPLQLAGKLYQDSRDYQGNSGEDQPKSSCFYIIDKVLKFLLAAGGLSVPRRAVRSGAAGTVVGNSVYSGFRQHWYSSQGQECLLILREKKRELEVCWKEWGWEGWARRGILQVPVSANTEFSLYLLQNYLWLLQIYDEVLYKLVSEKRSKRVNSVQSTRKWGHLGIYAQVDFAPSCIDSST